MAQKELEPDSQYEKYDINGDGVVTDEEFEMDQKLQEGRRSTQNGVVCACRYVVVPIFGCVSSSYEHGPSSKNLG